MNLVSGLGLAITEVLTYYCSGLESGDGNESGEEDDEVAILDDDEQWLPHSSKTVSFCGGVD